MSAAELHDLGVAQLSRALAAKEVSSAELVDHLLARIDPHHHLGTFLHVDAEGARAAAKAADAERARGEGGALTGVPLAHKDTFVARGMPSTAGSKILEGYASPFDATVVVRLGAGGAGMVNLGKLS